MANSHNPTGQDWRDGWLFHITLENYQMDKKLQCFYGVADF